MIYLIYKRFNSIIISPVASLTNRISSPIVIDNTQRDVLKPSAWHKFNTLQYNLFDSRRQNSLPWCCETETPVGPRRLSVNIASNNSILNNDALKCSSFDVLHWLYSSSAFCACVFYDGSKCVNKWQTNCALVEFREARESSLEMVIAKTWYHRSTICSYSIFIFYHTLIGRFRYTFNCRFTGKVCNVKWVLIKNATFMVKTISKNVIESREEHSIISTFYRHIIQRHSCRVVELSSCNVIQCNTMQRSYSNAN